MKHSGHINNLKFTYCCFGIIAVGIFGGCPPLPRLWDRPEASTQDDLLLIQAPACIGLNFNYTSLALPTHRRTAVHEPQTGHFLPHPLVLEVESRWPNSISNP